jgi:hypothetical protein
MALICTITIKFMILLPRISKYLFASMHGSHSHSHLKSEKLPGQQARVLSSCPAYLLLCRTLRVPSLRTGFRGTRSHAENFILF